VAVRAEDDPLASGDALAHRAEHRGVLRRQGVSHRIGQVDGRSAFRDGHFHYLAEVVEIGPARVFGGELDVVGVAPRLADGLARQFEDLFASQPELVLEVKLRGRDEDVEPGARRIPDRIACERDVLRMTTRERCQYRAPDFAGDLLHAAEVALRGGGEAGLDDIDPQSIELAGEAELLLGRHGIAWGLFPVPQGRVENENVLQHCVSRLLGGQKENRGPFRGPRREGLDVVSTMLARKRRDPRRGP
jgi:hypothetical protein